MKRSINLSLTILFLQCFAVLVFAQNNLSGTWEGKLVSPLGERPTTATFKQEAGVYTGTMIGLRGEMKLKDIKFDGDKFTAKSEIESPQGAIVIDYKFVLQGDALKGTGATNFAGNDVTLEIDLKRAAAAATTAPADPSQAARPVPRAQRVQIGQPQQKQTIDYFVGEWSFKFIGRESAYGSAPREGKATFTKRPDGKSVSGTIAGQSDSKPYKETSIITFDEATKKMKFDEKLSTGLKLQSEGDWSSPIAIKFTIPPMKVKGQSLQLKRTISIVSPHSFSVLEELSENGGPFVRLGNAIFSKSEAK